MEQILQVSIIKIYILTFNNIISFSQIKLNTNVILVVESNMFLVQKINSQEKLLRFMKWPNCPLRYLTAMVIKMRLL